MKAKRGFTLVEILIVVVILGILAAIVIPQFSEASTEAKTSSMISDLQTTRSQIQLYKIHHNDNWPASHGDTANDFAAAMTSWTDVDGDAQTAPGDGVYGPYLQAVPTNPWNNLDSVREVTTDSTAANTDGWWFNTVTGNFRADDTQDGNHVTW